PRRARARHPRRMPGPLPGRLFRRDPHRAVRTCSHCLTGRAQTVPTPERTPPINSIIGTSALEALRDGHPDALGAPRQQARFLAGITSPATSRAKLTQDPLFGSLADRRFGDVLAWCETTLA